MEEEKTQTAIQGNTGHGLSGGQAGQRHAQQRHGQNRRWRLIAKTFSFSGPRMPNHKGPLRRNQPVWNILRLRIKWNLRILADRRGSPSIPVNRRRCETASDRLPQNPDPWPFPSLPLPKPASIL